MLLPFKYFDDINYTSYYQSIGDNETIPFILMSFNVCNGWYRVGMSFRMLFRKVISLVWVNGQFGDPSLIQFGLFPLWT